MNERIRQLAEQAKDYADYYSMLSDSAEQEIFTEKFAELIVQECADTLTDRWEMRNEIGVRRAEYHAKRIKQHFGVEE